MASTSEVRLYPTEPLKCFNLSKELRDKYYKDFANVSEKGGLRWSGSGITPFPLVAGLGRDVFSFTGEPYGATAGYFHDFAIQCQEACDQAGIPRDLCAYARNYWGSILLDKFHLADGTILDHWIKPDFLFTAHTCCTHSKWYQRASELEGGLPFYGIDASPIGPSDEVTPIRINYIVEQYLDAIEWLQKITGREYNDELLIEAIENNCRTRSLWAQICVVNQAIPAPLNERRMFNFYVHVQLAPHTKEVVDLYEVLLDEVKDRVARGIACVPTERFRFMNENQPPWPFLSIYRGLEADYGAVSVASPYTFGLSGNWTYEEDGTRIPAKLPEEMGFKFNPKDREGTIRAWVEYCSKLYGVGMGIGGARGHSRERKRDRLRTWRMVQDWHIDAQIAHLNRGCEATAMYGPERTIEAREDDMVPRLEIEGNMADPRDMDLPRTLARIETFMESLGVERITK